MADKDVIQINALKGVNQRAEETALPEGSVREAINVMLDNAGTPKRRAGYTQTLALNGAHSLWSNDDVMVCVDSGDLYRVDVESGVVVGPLREGVGNEPLSYTVVNDWLFYSSERVHGRLNLYTLEHRDYWGVPQPDGVTLSVGAGALPAGQYQVAVTVVDDSGQESGVDAPAVITLSSEGGIVVSDIRVPTGAAKAHIYCSMTNDTRLYRQATVSVDGSYTITQLKRGKECSTLFLEPLPAGHIVRMYKGRAFVARENVVHYSNALHYGLYEPDNGYLPPFPSKVTMIEAVEDGLYVSADKTYFVRGSAPDDFSMSVVDQGRAILGSSMQVNAQYVIPEYIGNVAYWFDAEGPVVGVSGGMIQHLTLQSLTGTTATTAASMLVRDGGIDRIVTALADGAPRSNLGASDSAEITIIKSTSL